MSYEQWEAVVLVWSLFWVFILLTQGYGRMQYPGAERGVNPFNKAQMDRVRRKGLIWILISILAIVAGFIIPGLFSG